MPKRLSPEETYHAYGVIPCALTGGYLGDRGANIKDIRFGSGAMVRLRPFRIRLGTLGKLRGVKIWGTIPQVKEALIRSAQTMKKIHERQGEEKVELTWVFLCPRRLKVSQSEVMQRCRVDLMIEPSRGWDLVHVRGKSEQGFADAMEFIIQYTELGKFDLTMELQVLGQNICFPIEKGQFKKHAARNQNAEDEYRQYSGMDDWQPREYRTFQAEPSRYRDAPQYQRPGGYNMHEQQHSHQRYSHGYEMQQQFAHEPRYGNHQFGQAPYPQQFAPVQAPLFRAPIDELPPPPMDYRREELPPPPTDYQRQQPPAIIPAADSRLQELVPKREAKRRPDPRNASVKSSVTVSELASLISFCAKEAEAVKEAPKVNVVEGKVSYAPLLDGFLGGTGEIIPEERKVIRGRKRKRSKQYA